MTAVAPSIPRGRHAPPLAERQERDRARLAQAGIELIEQHAPMTAEAISRTAGIAQRFVHTFRGAGIQYEEYVENAVIDFTVATDQDLTEREWAMLWLTGEQNGIGATRSQGYGRYTVTCWEPITKSRRGNLRRVA